MEKVVRSCDKEYMKMAMLKHEQTFREQVYELHRLYRIQKILMKNIEVSEGGWYFHNTISNITSNGHIHHQKGTSQEKPQLMFPFNLDQQQQQPPVLEEHIAESEDNNNNNNNNNNNGILDFIEESEIELTLGPSSYYNNNNRKIIKKVIVTPITWDSGHSLSSSSTGSSDVNNKTRFHNNNGVVIRQNFDAVDEERLRQESLKKQAPWLFHQVFNLNLNMTREKKHK